APSVPKCQRMLTNSVGGGSLSSKVPYPTERRPRNWPWARPATTSANTATASNDGRFILRSTHLVDEPLERRLDVEILEAELVAQHGLDVGGGPVLAHHLCEDVRHTLRRAAVLAQC